MAIYWHWGPTLLNIAEKFVIFNLETCTGHVQNWKWSSSPTWPESNKTYFFDLQVNLNLQKQFLLIYNPTGSDKNDFSLPLLKSGIESNPKCLYLYPKSFIFKYVFFFFIWNNDLDILLKYLIYWFNFFFF